MRKAKKTEENKKKWREKRGRGKQSKRKKW